MLAPSRTTTEQRFHMDALELGNDYGSLKPAEMDAFPPSKRGYLSWIQHCGLWINTGLEAALDKLTDGLGRRAGGREIEPIFSHPPPPLPHCALDSEDLG
jgi:hypothetical protein